MCGRYMLKVEADFERDFGLSGPPPLFESYNIAPTRQIPVVLRDEAGRRCELMRWGLVPGWAKALAIGHRMFNARAETVAEKPAFRSAVRRRRCLVPAGGYYEWQRAEDGAKQPYLFRPARTAPWSGRWLCFAAIGERWTDRESGERVASVAIVTTAANETAAAVHDRMPVLLDEAGAAAWLEPGEVPPLELLVPCPAPWLEAVAVGRRVNDARNDDPDLLEPLT